MRKTTVTVRVWAESRDLLNQITAATGMSAPTVLAKLIRREHERLSKQGKVEKGKEE